jgi:hypothetical protein
VSCQTAKARTTPSPSIPTEAPPIPSPPTSTTATLRTQVLPLERAWMTTVRSATPTVTRTAMTQRWPMHRRHRIQATRPRRRRHGRPTAAHRMTHCQHHAPHRPPRPTPSDGVAAPSAARGPSAPSIGSTPAQRLARVTSSSTAFSASASTGASPTARPRRRPPRRLHLTRQRRCHSLQHQHQQQPRHQHLISQQLWQQQRQWSAAQEQRRQGWPSTQGHTPKQGWLMPQRLVLSRFGR